jgi:protein-tyrosine-phosphatase
MAAIAQCLVFVSYASAEIASPSAALEVYIEQRLAESTEITQDRKEQLDDLSRYIKSELNSGQTVRLTFICTHNSRRSHLAQIWSAVAASHFGAAGVETFSGGTEATAMNSRIVGTLERAGFTVTTDQERENPVYQVVFDKRTAAMRCFSKKYDDRSNPSRDFCAVMTCSDADENCPVIPGTRKRVAIPYEDPKVSDGSADEQRVYDERCAQIAREMLYVFSQIDRVTSN